MKVKVERSGDDRLVMVYGVSKKMWEDFRDFHIQEDQEDGDVLYLYKTSISDDDVKEIEIIGCTEAPTPLNIWAAYVEYEDRFAEGDHIILDGFTAYWLAYEFKTNDDTPESQIKFIADLKQKLEEEPWWKKPMDPVEFKF